MKDARFLFIQRGGFDPTVIDSQVVDSIVAVQEHGIRFDLIAFTEGGNYLKHRAYHRARRDEIAARTGGRVRAHFCPRQGRREGNAWATAVLLAEIARGGTRRTVIHARGDGPAFYASRAQRLWPGVRFVYDVRGDSEAEFALHPDIAGLTEPRRETILRQIRRERAAGAARASHVLCVSSVLRDRLVERHGIPAGRITVVPCVADTRKFHPDEAERRATRRELGLEDRFVVVYPGRFGRWHYAPETIAVVEGLMRVHPDLFFLVLTPDVEEAQGLAKARLPEGRYEIRTARHAEVPRYLRAADLGLLLREPHPLNEAACPTKFAEYVSCGLPVMISRGIGDCSPFVGENAAGVVLDGPDPDTAAAALARLRSEPADPRRARIAALSTRFSRERAAREMAGLYRRLAES